MKEFTLQPDRKPSAADRSFLDDLNEQQRRAAEHTEGPLLIIAGAGSGKTRVLTYRIANLLALNKAEPWQILSLTFTNKAAREMQERIGDLIGEKARKLWMGTFHSVFARILRYECEALGYGRDFSIYDTEDSERLIRTIMQEQNIDTKEVRPRRIRFIISGAKNQLIGPSEFADRFVQSTTDDIAANILGIYTNRLKQNNAMDFDDLLIKPIELFEQNEDILEKYRQRFRYLLIDEYQDTNHAQYRVTRLLAGGHRNLCVVGDDAQSIYSFRGADIGNILDFKKDYPEAEQIPLEQNYRSTKVILQCADALIKHNSKQLEKTLWTQNSDGRVITVLDNANDRDEANRVSEYVDRLRLQHGYALRDMAIMYRTNYQSRVFEEMLRHKGIAYQLVGGLSFYQRREIKDVIAYLKLLVNPHDEESLLRVINEPARGVGDKSIRQLRDLARQQNTTIWQVIQDVENTPVYKPAQKSIRGFVDTIRETVDKLNTTDLVSLVRELLDRTGYVKQFVEENSHESLGRRENVLELLNAISHFEQSTENPSLSRFLQDVSLVSDLDAHDTTDDRVTLLTVHSAKGLEFPVVFVVGLEEELFPMGGWNDSEADIEEERRLFYVAITRARQELFFSFARSRYKFGEEKFTVPSRFLDEVDPGVVRTETGATWSRKHTTASPSPLSSRRPSPSRDTRIDYDDEYSGPGSEIDDEPETGLRIMHQKFGPGKIISKEGQGEQTRLTVFFEKHGQKKLMLKYANLKRLE